MLDLVRNQLKPIVDLTVLCLTWGQSAWRPRAVRQRKTSAILPRGVLELGARIRGHRLVTSDIRAFDTFLSSMKHHQVLCLVCMSFKVYLGRDPLETRISLVKNGL